MKKLYLMFSLTTLGLGTANAQIPSNIPTNGLLAYYGFDGNSNDATNNAYHLINNGAILTTDRNGKAGSAYSFDGSTAYMSISNFPYSFSYAGEHTVSFWMKKNTTSGIAMMNGASSGSNFVWLFQAVNNTAMQAGVNKQGSSWTWATGTGAAFTVGQWEHYTAVYSNKTLTLYKNGLAVASSTANYSSPNSTTQPLWIGRGVGAATTNWLDGSLDDMAIWNRALTPTEVTQVYQTNLSANDFAQKHSFRVYPNPAKDMINIQTGNPSEFLNFTISDINGRIVKKGSETMLGTNTIDIKNLKPGVYFLNINNLVTEKIIVE